VTVVERFLMSVLIIKNIAAEGPGTIEDYLRAKNLPYSIVDLSREEAVPGLDSFTHLVIMGGPMAVYEMDRHTFLIKEAMLLERAVRAGKCILGVCLGAQMVAHVLGARVYPGPQKEIGWYDATLTPHGMSDALMSELKLPDKDAARVFQWHGDTFELPPGSVRLALSDLYSNQAFRYTDRVYGLQFHIEVTPAIVSAWLKHEKGVDFSGITSESEKIFDSYRERAMKFYQGFFRG
jgi:GMP synthase (glutamine-hydrolysing)